MEPWNVVITVHEGYYRPALELLEPLGELRQTEFFNVLVMKTAEAAEIMKMFKSRWDETAEVREAVARFVPAAHTFFFTSPEEFNRKARETVLPMADDLAGKNFYVRMHRRGFKKRISSMEAETFLAGVLLETLEKIDSPGTITFTDPDAVIAVETVGQQAGITLFTREELRAYPFLHLD